MKSPRAGSSKDYFFCFGFSLVNERLRAFEQIRRKGKLNYTLNTHARKSLPGASSKELVLFLAKQIYVQNFIKLGREMGAPSWTQA